MTDSIPRLIVTLTGRNASACRTEAIAARDAGADAAEVRIDRWPPEERRHLDALFPSALPLLATVRSRTEGGEGPDDPAERAALFEAIEQLPFAYVDYEIDRDRDAIARARNEGPRRILSRHLGRSASWDDLQRQLEAIPPTAGIRKVVLPASLARTLELAEALRLDPAGPPRVVHTTGPAGALLRAWARRLGFPIVFCAMPEDDGTDRSPPVEAAQIPVDRIGPFLRAADAPPIFAVVGRPIGQSRSPWLHHRWFREERRTALYVALEPSSDEEFLAAVPALAAGGFRGLNVTHPLKGAALAAATRIAPNAEACGTANTLTFDGGDVEADNTDLTAVERRLKELRAEGRWDGRSVLVVGAGGAARSALAAAQRLGAEARVLARHRERAVSLAARFQATVDLGDRGRLRPPSLVVHATPVGRRAGEILEVDLASRLGPGTHLLDFVYEPTTPTLRELAQRAGATYEDGWRLLVYQAAGSYARWWGAPPPENDVAALLEGEPCAG